MAARFVKPTSGSASRRGAPTTTVADEAAASRADVARAVSAPPLPLSAAVAGCGRASESVASSAGTGGGGARKMIVVLEQASLESVKSKRGFELLNCDDHVGVHKKAGRDPAMSRPDITHQLLLALMDSPLNKAGHLQVYIETVGNILIEISPHTRIPRTFKRFAGLIVQLLHKMRVRAADSADTLLKVIRNPVTAHLPAGAVVVGLEAGARLVEALDLPRLLPADRPVVFVIGAMSKGDIAADYVTETFSISRYPLSAACAVGKLMNAYEHAWGVL